MVTWHAAPVVTRSSTRPPRTGPRPAGAPATTPRSWSTSDPGCPTSTCFRGACGCGRPAPRSRRCRARDLGYADPRGLPQLREAVADYLGRVRGVSTDSDHVVVCNGFAHGLGL